MHWVRRSLPPGVRHAAGSPPRRGAGPAGRRRLHDRHARPLVARRAARADAVRDEADRRPGLRAGEALGALARLARGVPAARPAAATLPLRLARDADVRRAAHVVTPSAYLRELALGWGVPADARDDAPEPGARRCPSSRRATSCAREFGIDGPDARLRRPPDGAEVARRRHRGGAPRRHRARDRRRRPRPRRARAARPRALPRAAAPQGRARALPRRRCLAALVVLGELPAHGRRGARRRDARDRDAHRRRHRGRPGRRQRPRRPAGRPGRADGGDRAVLRRRRARRRVCARTPRPRRSPTTLPSACTGGSRRSCTERRDDARASSSSAAPTTGCRSTRAWRGSGTRCRSGSTCGCSRAAPGSDPRFDLVPPRRARRAALLRRRSPAGLRASCGRSSPTPSSPRARTRRSRAELARRVTRSPAKLVLEVHGDWHVSTRLYGSRRARVARAARRPARELGGAPGGRPPAVGEFTASLVRAEGESRAPCSRPTRTSACSPARSSPFPESPRVFVGVLERYKNVEVLARGVADRGRARARRRSSSWSARGRRSRWPRGSRAKAWSGSGGSSRRSSPRALDGARALLLPSESEGLPRVAIEAFLRGRAVIGSRAGGIPDIVEARAERPARRAGRQRRRSRRRSSGSSPITSSRSGSARRRAAAARALGLDPRRVRRQRSRPRRRCAQRLILRSPSRGHRGVAGGCRRVLAPPLRPDVSPIFGGAASWPRYLWSTRSRLNLLRTPTPLAALRPRGSNPRSGAPSCGLPAAVPRPQRSSTGDAALRRVPERAPRRPRRHGP